MRTNDRHTLEARGLSLRRGERILARDFNLTVQTGEIVAVRGASGSGKTTLLRAVAGLIAPEHGRVTLDGRSPRESGWPEYRSHVTYVGQQPAFVEGSVRDNLARPFGYRFRSEHFSDVMAVELLEAWSLSAETLEQPAGQLSVGEQQRVALIRALLTKPWFLLLDEPTSALDSKTAKRVLSKLKREAKAGVLGMVIVSHDESVLETIETRAVVFPGPGR